MLLGRRPRSRLDLLKPNTAERVEQRQQKQKEQHDSRAKDRRLGVGDWRNYHQGGRWLPGTIKYKSGPVSFQVELSDGRQRRCHQDQVHITTVPVTLEMEQDGREDEIVSDIAIPAESTLIPTVPMADPVDSSDIVEGPSEQTSPSAVAETPVGAGGATGGTSVPTTTQPQPPLPEKFILSMIVHPVLGSNLKMVTLFQLYSMFLIVF